MSISTADTKTLRDLARQYAEIAALPVHDEKRQLWKNLNELRPTRPMVMINQVCWNEMNVNNEITAQCHDEFAVYLELSLRKRLYQWKHFPVDLVFENWINIPMAINNTGFGIAVQETTESTDPDNAVLSHCYTNLFETDADIEKIKTPVITHDEAETSRRMEIAHEAFDGILGYRPHGLTPYLSLWDPLSSWMGVENALYALIDKPDYIHKILSRMTDGYLSMLDQLEGQGLLSQPEQQTEIHCTGAYNDTLPASGAEKKKTSGKDLWMYGLAQMLGVVSPEMFDEFEVAYTSRICERFGLVYYGCCEPLDKKMDQVKKLPNVRKVSMSPWADHRRGAEEIGRQFVFSSKPNPANVAMTSFDESMVRKELTEIKKHCDDNGCPLEFILKDISTVSRDPKRLDKWAKIAMEVVTG